MYCTGSFSCSLTLESAMRKLYKVSQIIGLMIICWTVIFEATHTKNIFLWLAAGVLFFDVIEMLGPRSTSDQSISKNNQLAPLLAQYADVLNRFGNDSIESIEFREQHRHVQEFDELADVMDNLKLHLTTC
jgi:hypothetical protein